MALRSMEECLYATTHQELGGNKMLVEVEVQFPEQAALTPQVREEIGRTFPDD